MSNNFRVLITIFSTLVCLFYSSESLAQPKLISESCLTNNEFDDRYASYSPNGDKIVYESNKEGNWDVFLMKADGSNQVNLTNNVSDDRRPTWHPNGKTILFESNRSGKNELYKICLKNNKVRKLKLLKTEFDPIFGSYSPDGKFIAIALKESDQKSNIFLLNKKGKIIRQLTNYENRSFYPKWSKQKNEIVFFSRKDTDNKDDEIYKLNLDTNKEVRLTNWPKHNFCPAWSYDGSKIAYVTSMENSRPEIYIMDADGKNQIRITENDNGETLPNWSPIDDKILITAYRKGNFEICELEIGIEEK